MHLDTLLEHVNPYGKYQIITWLILSSFTCFPPAWHQFAITFTAYRPSHFGCSGVNTTSSTGIVGPNGTVNYPTSVRLPVVGHPCQYVMAHYSDNSSIAELLSIENGTYACTGDYWYSENDPITQSIITQWDLVCDREYISDLINTAEGTGEVIGCIIFGYIADRFGRKTGYFGSAAVLFASGLLCAFAWHPAVAVVARLIIGISLTGMNNIGFLMNVELFTPNARTLFSTGGELIWAIAVVALTGVGFLMRDSFWFMIAITMPLVFLVPFWWFLSESLHWNLSNGHHEQAKQTLRRIARFNNVQLDEVLLSAVIDGNRKNDRVVDDVNVNKSHGDDEDHENAVAVEAQSLMATTNKVMSSHSVSLQSSVSRSVSALSLAATSLNADGSGGGGWVVRDLFKTPRVRMITIFLTLLWFANTMCYYGLQLAAQYIEGIDFYLSFFILAIVEVPSIFAVAPPMHWLGRRWAIVTFQIIGSITIIAVAFVPPGYEVLTISVAAVGKFAVCASFTALYVYAVELFPTTIRGTGFGVISLVGRIGMIFAPLINSLGYGESTFPSWARNVIYGVSMIATVFLTLPLPETSHQPLADTIEEMENYAQYCQNYHKSKTVAATMIQENKRKSMAAAMITISDDHNNKDESLS